MRSSIWSAASLLIAMMAFAVKASAQPVKDYFTVESYYKIKWGHNNEFIDLWKANHYPLLKKALAKGDIVSVKAEQPRLHGGEDTRWDFKVTIVFKDSRSAFDAELTTPYKKELYPDTAKLARDENERFGLLLAHWDVMTEQIPLQ